MKYLITYLFIFYAIFSCAPQKEVDETNDAEKIRINQIGYFPSGPKRFIVADLEATSFSVIDDSGQSIFDGELIDEGTWEKSGEKIYLGDFSALQKSGKYRIQLDNNTVSFPFEVGNGIYRDLKKSVLKSYYLHRISMPIEAENAGVYARPIGHEDLNLKYHSSTGKEGTLNTPGGWYDAGDYGKYMINAGVSTGLMLAAFEKYPESYPDGMMQIPESGNGVPDLLDELRYEIEWMLTMQDVDGGAFVKVTTLNFSGMVMPHEAPRDRMVIGKSTAATLHIAAIGAMASRIYQPYDKEFSSKCLEASQNAWQWALRNPEVYYDKNPEGVATGAYNDVVLDEEFFWAAAELYISTEKSEYFERIKDLLGDIQFRLEENWRNYVDNIGYYSLVNENSPLDQDQKDQVTSGILRLADQLIEKHNTIPYKIPVDHFVWGSNSDVLDAAIIFSNAYEINQEQKYLNHALESFDYILGKNAVGYSFITGFGSKRAMKIHHRPSEADGIEAPLPGFVIGGPNFRMEDKASLESAGFMYESELPAKAYIDALPSFASNEICINWNAPCVYMMAFINHQMDQP